MIKRSLHLLKRTMSTIELVEQSKKLAAYKAVDDYVTSENKVIGVGSGSTVVYVSERLGQLPFKHNFVCIPTGFQSKQIIMANGLHMGSTEEFPDIDVTFDGADEIDQDLNCIKGGGACLMQEKLVASCSRHLVIVADFRKESPSSLGIAWKKGVPIEVIPSAYTKIILELQKLGAVSSVIRPGGVAKAGPVVTDNSNFIIDADFGEIPTETVRELHDKIKHLTGVVEVGLFVDMAEAAYIGEANGEVQKLVK